MTCELLWLWSGTEQDYIDPQRESQEGNLNCPYENRRFGVYSGLSGQLEYRPHLPHRVGVKTAEEELIDAFNIFQIGNYNNSTLQLCSNVSAAVLQQCIAVIVQFYIARSQIYIARKRLMSDSQIRKLNLCSK